MKLIIKAIEEFKVGETTIGAGKYAGIIENKYVFLVDGKETNSERKAKVVEFENKTIAHQTLEEIRITFPTGKFEVEELPSKEEIEKAKEAFAKAEAEAEAATPSASN